MGRDPLSRAVAAHEDDFEHPTHDVLEAFVDGSLDAADREWVESHAEGCAVCLDDIGDLTRMREALRVVVAGAPAAPAAASVDAPDTTRRWFVAAAAVVIIGSAAYFWMVTRRTDAPVTTAAVAAPAAPAPPPSAPVAADPLTADERARVDRVLASGTIEVPAAVASLASRRGTLLGGRANDSGEVRDVLTPTTPVGTAVTATTPSFAWTPVKDASAYDVAVFDERFNEVASVTGVTGTTWTPTKALPRGVTLSWQVTAHVAGHTVLAPVPPQPEARFLVVDAGVEAAVAADRQRLAADHVALAVLLAEKGLFVDALAELKRAPAGGQAIKVRAAIDALTRR